MIKIDLKRAIRLPIGEKTTLAPGKHEIDEANFSHWFIQGLVHTGDIVVINDVTGKTPSLKAYKPMPENKVIFTEIKSKTKVEEEAKAKIEAEDKARKEAIAQAEEKLKVGTVNINIKDEDKELAEIKAKAEEEAKIKEEIAKREAEAKRTIILNRNKR